MTDRIPHQFINPPAVADGYYLIRVVGGVITAFQPSAPVVLINNGGSVPVGTPAGSIIVEKA